VQNWVWLQETISMRKKEGLSDYRYFPEPDLMPLLVSKDQIESVRAAMAELPSALRTRLLAAGLPVDVVLIISEDVAIASYFDAAVAAGADEVQAGNWIQRDLMAWCNEVGVSFSPLPAPCTTKACFAQW
jgi:aspartyl-tRNA(Asn)/glutamyl-tRNA(Gln) amidotransferase subunit B